MGTSITLPQNYDKRQQEYRRKHLGKIHSTYAQRNKTYNPISLDNIIQQKQNIAANAKFNEIKLLNIYPLNVKAQSHRVRQSQDKTQAIYSIHSIEQLKNQQNLGDQQYKIYINRVQSNEIKIDIKQNEEMIDTGIKQNQEMIDTGIKDQQHVQPNDKNTNTGQIQNQQNLSKQEYSIWNHFNNITKEHFKRVHQKRKSQIEASKMEINKDNVINCNKQNKSSRVQFSLQQDSELTEQGDVNGKRRNNLAVLSIRSKIVDKGGNDEVLYKEVDNDKIVNKEGNNARLPRQLIKKHIRLGKPQVYRPLLHRRKLKEIIYHQQQIQYKSVILHHQSS